MTNVAKYNTFKGLSTALTFGTPVIATACMGEFFKTPASAISGTAVFALLLGALFAKDKIAENFKAPSALIVAAVVLIFCIVVENILLPLKIVSAITLGACGVDELSFKNLYKRAEMKLPLNAKEYKRFGFYGVRQKTLDGTAEVSV